MASDTKTVRPPPMVLIEHGDSLIERGEELRAVAQRILSTAGELIEAGLEMKRSNGGRL